MTLIRAVPTPELLQALVFRLDRKVAELSSSAIIRASRLYDISTDNRMMHALAQWAEESGLRANIREDMARYTADNLLDLWPNRFTLRSARQLAGNATAVGDLVYGGRMGNVLPHDGSKFVGHGPTQLTGASNFEQYSKRVGYDLVAYPQLALQYGVGWRIAGAFFQDHGCNQLADKGGLSQVRPITRAINGGFNGLEGRSRYYLRLCSILSVDPTKGA